MKKPPGHTSKFSILFALLFLAVVCISAAIDSIPEFLVIGYFALSVVTFGAYSIDKSAARRRTWRTSEGTLLLFGLAGGWPGALIAQEMLRHKSKKTSFRALFWMTVIANCVGLAWLQTTDGKAAVERILY